MRPRRRDDTRCKTAGALPRTEVLHPVTHGGCGTPVYRQVTRCTTAGATSCAPARPTAHPPPPRPSSRSMRGTSHPRRCRARRLEPFTTAPRRRAWRGWWRASRAESGTFIGKRTADGVVMPTVLPTVGRGAPTKKRGLGPLRPEAPTAYYRQCRRHN